VATARLPKTDMTMQTAKHTDKLLYGLNMDYT